LGQQVGATEMAWAHLNFRSPSLSLSLALSILPAMLVLCLFSLLLFAGAKVLIFIINYETFVEKAQNLKKATDRKRQS